MEKPALWQRTGAIASAGSGVRIYKVSKVFIGMCLPWREGGRGA